MADATVFVVSLLVTIVALIWGFIYLRSRSQSFRKDFSAVQSMARGTDDERESSTNEDAKSSSATRKPERWTTEEPWNSGSSRKQKGDTVDRDPLDYCDHIQREMKRTKHRLAMEKIEAEMTEEQKEEERQAQRLQLEEIFKLMQKNKEEFGLASVDEIQEQMKLYINT